MNFQAEEADYERWKIRARELKVSFGQFARDTLNGATGSTPPPVVREFVRAVADEAKAREAEKPSRGGERAARPCEHRLPKGSWCKSCQRVV